MLTHTPLSQATAAALISPSPRHAQLPRPSFTTPLSPPDSILRPLSCLLPLPHPSPHFSIRVLCIAQLSLLFSLPRNNAPHGILALPSHSFHSLIPPIPLLSLLARSFSFLCLSLCLCPLSSVSLPPSLSVLEWPGE